MAAYLLLGKASGGMTEMLREELMDQGDNWLKRDIAGEGFSFMDAFHRAGLVAGWEDARYGYGRGYLDEGDTFEYAVAQVEAGDDAQPVLELAWPDNGEREIEALLGKLTEGGYDSASAERRWRYVLMRWIQEADVAHEERLLMQDLLYLSFGCPADLNFISSVVTFGDDFWREPHTAEECRKHHRERIEEFLREEAAALGAVDNKRE